jgi:hypothetical protein
MVKRQNSSICRNGQLTKLSDGVKIEKEREREHTKKLHKLIRSVRRRKAAVTTTIDTECVHLPIYLGSSCFCSCFLFLFFILYFAIWSSA